MRAGHACSTSLVTLKGGLAQVEECLEREKLRVATYLLARTEPVLVEVLRRELLDIPQQQLIEREGSGVRALLKQEQRQDLHRMYDTISH